MKSMMVAQKDVLSLVEVVINSCHLLLGILFHILLQFFCSYHRNDMSDSISAVYYCTRQRPLSYLS